MFVFLFCDSNTMSHLPFTCNWQNRFWDSEPIIARFPINKGGNLDIRISHNTTELHPAPCMCVVCCVCGLGLSCMSKHNVLSLILFIPSMELTKKRKGHLIIFSLLFLILLCYNMPV